MINASQTFAGTLDLSGFELTTSVSFSSTVPEHRTALRTLAYDRLSAQIANPESRTDLQRLRDLAARPRIENWAISISHCPGLGGLAIAPGGFGLGFDVEMSSRVTEAAAFRVAHFHNEKAIVAKEAPVSFWAAKEASIKAFGNLGQVDLNFAGVEITSMDANGTFTSRWQTQEARGLLLSENTFTLAIARTL